MSNSIDLANRLLRIRKEIEETKELEIKLKTKLESAIEQLPEGINTEEEAVKELGSLNKKIRDLNQELENDLQELEETYSI